MNHPLEILWGVGVVVLLGILVWSVVRKRQRNPANDRIAEEATRESYQHPETYAQKREELKKQIRR